jgi:hypothetical protein
MKILDFGENNPPFKILATPLHILSTDCRFPSNLLCFSLSETVPLAYVLGGVFGGVVVIVLVALGLFICNRRKNDRPGK